MEYAFGTKSTSQISTNEDNFPTTTVAKRTNCVVRGNIK